MNCTLETSVLFDLYLPEAIHLLMLLVGIILLVKKVADMDRYHGLRVVILTSILTCIVVYFELVTATILGSEF
ncbi:MAG TPA: hypothetical protein VF088_11435 [Pyrinomonadaceae bacterium]